MQQSIIHHIPSKPVIIHKNKKQETTTTGIGKKSPVSSFFIKNMATKNPNLNEQKKFAHRRATSLSINELDPLNNNIKQNQFDKKTLASKMKKRLSTNEINIEDVIDGKHKKLLSQGIISPPIDLTSPQTSPQSSSSSLDLFLKKKNLLQRSIELNSDLLSTINDIEEELELSYDDENDSLCYSSNGGRFAPNPFKMISGGHFDLERIPESRIGCVSAPPFEPSFFPSSPPTTLEIDQNYFQRRRSSSFGQEYDIIFCNDSAFKSFEEEY